MLVTQTVSFVARELITSHQWNLDFLRLRALASLANIEALEVSGEQTNVWRFLYAISADIAVDLELSRLRHAAPS